MTLQNRSSVRFIVGLPNDFLKLGSGYQASIVYFGAPGTKSKLQAILLQLCKRPVVHPREREILPAKSAVSTFIVDMMASIRTLTALPDTCEELTWKFIKSLPSGCYRVDIVADTYQDQSIKSAERQKRGSAERILIQSARSKMPRNFSDFLKNGENKLRLMNFIEECLKEIALKCLTHFSAHKCTHRQKIAVQS